jgi:Flp pilus assembly protein TadG
VPLSGTPLIDEDIMLRGALRSLQAAIARGRSIGRNEAGSMLSMLAVVPVLAGTVAIGVETGELYRVKRQMQGAADDAALAGSIDSIAGGATSASITPDARYETQRNGFTNGTGGVTVAVHSPPVTGGNIATAGAVEVVIQKQITLSFGSLLNSFLPGSSPATFTISARSVAAQTSTTASVTTTTSSTTAEGCMVALTTANEQAISLSSFNNFSSDCSIMANGKATGTGSSASINMSNFNNATLHSTDASNPARIWTAGSFSASSYNHLTTDATLQNQATAITDPYSSLANPSPGTCTYTNYVEPGGSDLTLSPGTYCGGLSVTSKSNVYFTHGTYYIANGDLIIRSDNNVSCSDCTSANGLTFVLTQTTGNATDIGGVAITSENNVTLSAGTSGTFPGVLFYQDRRVAAGTMTSTSKIFTVASLNNATLNGAVYFPQNRIDISSINNIGGTSTTGCTIWIGRYLKFSSYNNAFKGGCSTYGTTPAGITTTTTQTTNQTTYKNKVLE